MSTQTVAEFRREVRTHVGIVYACVNTEEFVVYLKSSKRAVLDAVSILDGEQSSPLQAYYSMAGEMLIGAVTAKQPEDWI